MLEGCCYFCCVFVFVSPVQRLGVNDPRKRHYKCLTFIPAAEPS